MYRDLRPLQQSTTLTSNPSATSSSHERTAAPWPAASGIEAEHDPAREPAQQLGLLRRQRRAARRPRRAPPRPGTPARNRNSPRPAPTIPEPADVGLRQVQAVEGPPLRVNRRFGRIQVLRALLAVHRPAPEGDHRPESRQIGIISRWRNRSTDVDRCPAATTRPLAGAAAAASPCCEQPRVQARPAGRRVAEPERLPMVAGVMPRVRPAAARACAPAGASSCSA